MRTDRRTRILLVGLLLAIGAFGVWRVLAPSPTINTPNHSSSSAAVAPSDCAECHRAQYDTWQKTYHRTMTREAAPENVKGDFSDVNHNYRGFTSRLTREGDLFFMETMAPDWAEQFARTGGRADLITATKIKLRVDRLVGSHWLQEYLHRAPNGKYIRLPLLYHIAEHRWVQSNGAFLAPDTDDFWAQSRGATWNESCLYCHNTEPSKNPIIEPRRGVVGYATDVAELGIACAACHGHGADHVRKQRDPAFPASSDVVHPGRLSVPRRDEICARCHAALVPKPAMWDPITHRDPFVPGLDLRRFNHMFHSEREQSELAAGRPISGRPPAPGPTDGRFWGDGTPLTTALEFNGMALSACYEGGRGTLSCSSCHTMHGEDPNMLLKPKMRTNEACYQCHPGYRDRLAEHTHHPHDSSGSLCYSCHMAPQVYSLMTTHRSHRIQTPDLASSLGTGKPHACNLCHLDKSVGWTRDQLATWPNGKRTSAGTLSTEEESVSSAVLVLSRGDARGRVVFAGAFSSPSAQRASGTDWQGSMLVRLLEHERYPAVRTLAHRGLGAAAGPFDPLASPAQRRKQLETLRAHFDAKPIRRTLPALPLTPDGLPDESRLDKLRSGRLDPDLTVNE